MPSILSILLAVSVLGGSFLAWHFSPERVRLRRVRAAPVKAPADLADGEVAKLRGTVVAIGKALRAPLSGRRCTHYALHVQEHPTDADWNTIHKEGERRDFILRCANDLEVRVAMENAEIWDEVDPRRGWIERTPELEKFLAKRKLSRHEPVRCREIVLEVGEVVSVFGKLGTEDDPNPSRAGHGYRDSPKRRVIDAPDGARLIVAEGGDFQRALIE